MAVQMGTTNFSSLNVARKVATTGATFPRKPARAAAATRRTRRTSAPRATAYPVAATIAAARLRTSRSGMTGPPSRPGPPGADGATVPGDRKTRILAPGRGQGNRIFPQVLDRRPAGGRATGIIAADEIP